MPSKLKTSDNQAEITIQAEQEHLEELKQSTLKKLQPEVSAAGFRKGKVPLHIVEKQVDDRYLHSQFLDEALNALYAKALDEHKLRTLSQPEVEVKTFVPFSELTFVAKVEVVPEIKLADPTKLKVERTKIVVTPKDVDKVIEQLQDRMATTEVVKRAAKKGDEAVIDFAGIDANAQPIAGAKGEDYPLRLGSNSFIPGFEDKVVGLAAKKSKDFKITFPKDYGHAPLANKEVTFSVTVKEVRALTRPAVDDDFAAKVGPFTTVKELKEDVKKHLTDEKQQQADSDYRDGLVDALVAKSKITAPETLVREHVDQMLSELGQNLLYRGQTIDEFLKEKRMSKEKFIDTDLKPKAEHRVKCGLALAELAEQADIRVNADELKVRLDLLKQQYPDQQMQRELDNPTAQQRVASQIMTEKALDYLVALVGKAS